MKDAGLGADDHLVGAVSARQPATLPAALRNLRENGVVDAYIFAAYDCAEILVAALDRAIKRDGGKIPTREQVLNAVAATQDFKGLTGTFHFKRTATPPTPPCRSITHATGPGPSGRTPRSSDRHMERFGGLASHALSPAAVPYSPLCVALSGPRRLEPSGARRAAQRAPAQFTKSL